MFRRQVAGQPFLHADLAALVGDRGNGMGEDDRRIGQQPAEVAGVMVLGSQIDGEINAHAAA